MKIVVQRVKYAKVEVEGNVVRQNTKGFFSTSSELHIMIPNKMQII